MERIPLESSEYSGKEFIRQAGTGGMDTLAQRVKAQLFERFGMVFLVEMAPHGVYGYTVLSGAGEYFAADTVVHGLVIPLCFATRAAAEKVAHLVGGQAVYSQVKGLDASRYEGAARFANKGPVVIRFPLDQGQ